MEHGVDSKGVDDTTKPDAKSDQVKPERSADLTKSILAGEISDHSECSVEIDDQDSEANCDYLDHTRQSKNENENENNADDGDMSIEDRDQDIEEEEEFHEIREAEDDSIQSGTGIDAKLTPSPLDKTNGSAENSTSESATTPSAPKPSSPKPSSPKPEDTSTAPENSPVATKENTEQSKSSTPVTESTPEEKNIINPSKDDNAKDSEEIKKDTADSSVDATEVVEAESTSSKTNSKNADWADIMLSTQKDQDGDESAQADEKKELDLDEDVKNPQYIPKKGMFYEHDDRTGATSNNNKQSASAKKDDDNTDTKSGETSTAKKQNHLERQGDNRRANRRQRSDNDRWDHDRFRYDQQKPKNKGEQTDADGKQERAPRSNNINNQTENRPSKGMGNGNDKAERQQGGQENQRSRQNRENRDNRGRQGQAQNRSGDRRPRRQDNNRIRIDSSGIQNARRDPQNRRPNRSDLTNKNLKNDQHTGEIGKQSIQNNSLQTASNSSPSSFRREHQNQDALTDKGSRVDNRGPRRQVNPPPNANVVHEKLPPINTVMPPMTTWSNKIEDMVKEETSRKESPPSRQQQLHDPSMSNTNASSASKARNETGWNQNPIQRNNYHDRSLKGNEDPRRHQDQSQHYMHHSRKPQDRGEDGFKQAQFSNRNHYSGDRQNQHPQDWRRTGHYNNPHIGKPNDYGPIRTQTFENSRLAHANNINRSSPRDAREIIDRRMQNQHNFHSKIPPEQQHQQFQQHRSLDQQQNQLMQHPHHNQHPQMMHQHHPQHVPQHVRPHQSQQAGPMLQHQAESGNQVSQQHTTQGPQQQPQGQQQQGSQHQLPPSHRQHQSGSEGHPNQSRQGIVLNNIIDNVQDSGRLNSTGPNPNEMISTRPIIKAETFTGGTAPHASQHQSQQIQPHSQNHRSLTTAGGPISQQAGPTSGASHMVPSHLEASGNPAQYYAPSNNSRDPAAAAALASAYHGYLPGGHSVMDASRYHMSSQHVSDHGYMASAGQGNEVAAASVMHQPGMYNDATAAGGTVASSAYLAQAGSALSPSTNIPVTGSGPPPPMAPVSYMQHSQYAPPPYSNPYSQPQPNQAPPPQSSHGYPYWTYI